MSARVGIGVITMQNRRLSDAYLNLIDRPTPLYVHVDKERRGPGYGRNQCIKALMELDCDYIAIFDDDCYPIAPDWQTYLVENALLYDVHVISMPHQAAAEILHIHGELEYRAFNMGCFIFVSRHAVETIGYFDLSFGRYAFEDPDYLTRARRAGLTRRAAAGDLTLRNIYSRIFSEDAAPPAARSADFDSNANMSDDEKVEWIDRNRARYYETLMTRPVYVPFTT